MRDEGAMALAEALKTNISLYKLDLSNCTVSAHAHLQLAKRCICSSYAAGITGIASSHVVYNGFLDSVGE